MEKYRIKLMPKTEEDLEYFVKSGNKKRLKKIDKLMIELEEHPTTGTGKAERLRGDFSGRWSRRIDDEHRLVYRIDEENRVVIIYQMKDHYV
jgi:toxin YoeB